MKTISTIIIALFVSSSFAQVSYVIPNKHYKTQRNINSHSHVHSAHCHQKQIQKWIPGTYTQQRVPAIYKTIQVQDPYSCRLIQKQIKVRSSQYKTVFIPGHYISKTKWVCHTPSFRQNTVIRGQFAPKRFRQNTIIRSQIAPKRFNNSFSPRFKNQQNRFSYSKGFGYKFNSESRFRRNHR